MVQNEKFFQNVTCIVDFIGDNQDEKNKMFIALSGLSNHLMKKTSIKLHMILEEKDIINLLKILCYQIITSEKIARLVTTYFKGIVSS